MDKMNQRKIILDNKNKILTGYFCNLIPLREKDLEIVVNFRNQERNKYFLHQEYDITLQSQAQWFQEYIKRDNDIYWGIWNKCNVMVGTIRIYDIDENFCNEGSFIVDSKYSREAPYAVEAKYLLINYVFEVLKIFQIVNEDKSDNSVMNSLSKQMGFIYQKKTEIRGAEFNYYILTPETYQKEKMKSIIEYWVER